MLFMRIDTKKQPGCLVNVSLVLDTSCCCAKSRLLHRSVCVAVLISCHLDCRSRSLYTYIHDTDTIHWSATYIDFVHTSILSSLLSFIRWACLTSYAKYLCPPQIRPQRHLIARELGISIGLWLSVAFDWGQRRDFFQQPQQPSN